MVCVPDRIGLAGAMVSFPMWDRVEDMVCSSWSVDALRHHGVELIAARGWRRRGRPVPEELNVDERIAAIRTLGVPGITRAGASRL